MIQLTRLNNEHFALNADLIERIEAMPDTVLTLIDGTKYVVSDPLEQVIDRVVHFRARIIAVAADPTPGPALHLVDDDRPESDG